MGITSDDVDSIFRLHFCMVSARLGSSNFVRSYFLRRPDCGFNCSNADRKDFHIRTYPRQHTDWLNQFRSSSYGLEAHLTRHVYALFASEGASRNPRDHKRDFRQGRGICIFPASRAVTETGSVR